MSQVIKYKNGLKIINNYPDLTEEESKKIKTEILTKLYNLFFNKKELD